MILMSKKIWYKIHIENSLNIKVNTLKDSSEPLMDRIAPWLGHLGRPNPWPAWKWSEP